MAYGIGIDTGGTYTDAVIYDFETGSVLAKGKSPTTHENLMLGIGAALDLLPRKLLEQAAVVSLSTALATNACVENKGGRARLVLVGTEQSTLERVGADKKYGLDYDDVLCVETRTSYDGKLAEQPDWDNVISENEKLVALIYPDYEAIKKASSNANPNIEKIMQENIYSLNNEIPRYCKVSSFRIMEKEFEKTPKRSIKRYLYQK